MDWLATLFEHTEGLVELRALPNVRGEGRPHSLFTRDRDEVASFVQRFDVPGMGVYFGALTRREPPGNAKNAWECPAAWLDNDVTPKEELLATLKGCFMPPSLILDSGRGLHGWWLFTEPLEDLTTLPATLRELARIFSGDRTVCELARIMRLPGTQNSKYGEPRPVKLLHQNGRRYDYAELAEWAAGQRTLVGGNPFLAAAEAMGVNAPSLEDMRPGKVHETQLRASMAMLAAGKPEEEIVAAVLEATRAVAGPDWDMRKEEATIRGMMQTGAKKVVKLADHRPAANDGAVIRVARVALEGWREPLITVDGELFTYHAGAWTMFDPGLEHRLRVAIQAAVEALRIAPTSATLNGAFRWIHERPELVRAGVVWDRAGVIVGHNGALEMTSGRIVSHAEAHYATRRVACAIDPGGTCPVWRDFLRHSMPEGAEPTLQEWFGSALVRGKTRETTKGTIAYGPSRTDKTQVTEVLRALLGGNTVGLTVRAMGERFGMQPLITCSGWVADDACGLREELNAGAWKVTVTGESTSIERKNRAALECSLDIPVFLTMNNYPVIRDDSDACYNRTLVLPMSRQWSEEEAVPIARLVVGSELSGVLNWALQGWERLRARGRFDPPPCMIAAGRDFKNQNNPLEEFLALCIEPADDVYVMRDDLLRILNCWLKREVQPLRPWSGKAVGLAIAHNNRLKIIGDKIHRGRVWLNIRFTEAALAYAEVEFSHTKPTLEDLNHPFTPDLYERHHPMRKTRF